MPLPYQPKFLYRPRRNSPAPTPFGESDRGLRGLGEYLSPKPGFDGFGDAPYTLGSLSYRPGKDWSTPRYVREEPEMFMSGFGQDVTSNCGLDWLNGQIGKLIDENIPDAVNYALVMLGVDLKAGLKTLEAGALAGVVNALNAQDTQEGKRRLEQVFVDKLYSLTSNPTILSKGQAAINLASGKLFTWLNNKFNECKNGVTGSSDLAAQIQASMQAMAAQAQASMEAVRVEPVVEGSADLLAMLQAQYPEKFGILPGGGLPNLPVKPKISATTWLLLAGVGVGVYLLLKKRG